jgi:alkylation response protein AidB-like acyl-CoA dehydrogenase
MSDPEPMREPASSSSGRARTGLAALTLGALGVVFGDIIALVARVQRTLGPKHRATALTYCKQRKQFGKPLVSFQLIQDRLVKMRSPARRRMARRPAPTAASRTVATKRPTSHAVVTLRKHTQSPGKTWTRPRRRESL